MSALARAHGRDQPRPGLPRRGRAGRGARGRRARDPRRATTSTRRWPGVPALRAAIAEHQRRFYGLELDPDTEVQVTVRRDGGDRRRAARAVRARRRGGRASSPTTTPTRPAIAMAGATRRAVTLRPPDWPFDPDALAAAITRATRACCCSTRRTTRPARCSRAPSSSAIAAACRRARPDRDHRRGLRAPRLRRRAHPARDAARDGRAHADDLLARQDVLGDRLEDRAGRCGPPELVGGARGPPSSS